MGMLILALRLIYCTKEEKELLYEIREITSLPEFCVIKSDIFGCCTIPKLLTYCKTHNCEIPDYMKNKDINLCKLYQSNSGYKDGAALIWQHLNNVSDDVLYHKLISGIRFSIKMHIICFYKRVDGIYYPNFKLFLKYYKDEYLDNFKFLMDYLLSAIIKINRSYLTEVKRPIKRVRRIESDFRFNKNLVVNKHLESLITALKIVDCIPCTSCLVWGKIQFLGIITATKIHIGQEINEQETLFLINTTEKIIESSLLLNYLEENAYY